MHAHDEQALAVELERPTGHFLNLLAHGSLSPVPRHIVKAHGQAWAEVANIVTNGPFRLEAWQRGQSMVFARHAHYHGRFSGNVDRVEVRLMIPGQLQAYAGNALDVCRPYMLPPQQRERALRRFGAEYVFTPALSTWFLAFDVNRRPFDDARVRRALTMATDRAAIGELMPGRLGFTPASGGLVPPGMAGHSPGIALPYDPEVGRQLLAAAGYPNGCQFPPVDAMAFRVAGTIVILKWLQAHWRENLGVDITWELVKPSSYYHRVRVGRPHLHLCDWYSDYPDPDNFLRLGFDREAVGWRNERYEHLLREARRVMDQAERMRLYQEADRILVEEAPILPLFHVGEAFFLVKPWVRKYPGPWKDVIIEPH